MDCLILVGGEGQRLRSLSGRLPKPMFKIGQKTIIEHVVSKLLSQFNISRIFLLTKYRSELFYNHIDILSSYGCPINIVEQKQLLGTGGAIYEACSEDISENFIVCNGDTIIDSADKIICGVNVDLSKHNLLLSPMYDCADYDEVIFDKSNSLVDIKRTLISKAHYFSYSGFCVCNKELILKYSSFNSDINVNFERDIIKKFKNDFKVIKLNHSFYDLGTPGRVERAISKLGLNNE